MRKFSGQITFVYNRFLHNFSGAIEHKRKFTGCILMDSGVSDIPQEPTMYNGVLLPSIENVWTDKETYPYAVIVSHPNGDYSLVLQSFEMYVQRYNNGGETLVTERNSGVLYAYRGGFNWTPNGEMNYNLTLIAGDTGEVHGTPLWASYDLKYVDEPVEPDIPDTPTQYLTFASAEPFTIGVNNATKNWDGALYYSNDTETWNEWDGTTAIASAEHSGEQKIYMCGSGNTVITGSDIYARWVLNGVDIRCDGNIETLLDYETVANGEHPAMGDYCYYALFNYDCTALTSAPSLPATTLTDFCYAMMFRKTSLTTAPALPATTLAKSCYASMFHICESLTTAPALPATTLAERCYSSMFYNCPALTTLPELPATTLATECYKEMFSNCTGIKLSTTQTGEYTTEYRIPSGGEGVTGTYSLSSMFFKTGGAFTGTPSINTTYYTANEVIPVYD